MRVRSLHGKASRPKMPLTVAGRGRGHTAPVDHVRGGDSRGDGPKVLRPGVVPGAPHGQVVARVRGPDRRGTAHSSGGCSGGGGLLAVLRAVSAYSRHRKAALDVDGRPRPPGARARIARGNVLVGISDPNRRGPR